MDAANTAAALQHLGADVESALLELAVVVPTLDAKVREHLYFDMRAPRILRIFDTPMFVDRSRDYPTVRMHNAVSEILRYVDDEAIKNYLLARFPDYDFGGLYA